MTLQLGRSPIRDAPRLGARIKSTQIDIFVQTAGGVDGSRTLTRVGWLGGDADRLRTMPSAAVSSSSSQEAADEDAQPIELSSQS